MRRAIALGAVVVLATVAACGVPTDGGTTLSGPDDVPFGLLEEQPPPPVQDTSAADLPVEIYLVDDSQERLVPVTRRVTDRSLDGLVAALLDGPTAAEGDAGVTTAIPDEQLVLSVELAGGVAAVDLAETFADLDGDKQRLALGQLVFTLTGSPGVGRVAITLAGRVVEIPRGDGALTSGSVSRDAYRDIVASG